MFYWFPANVFFVLRISGYAFHSQLISSSAGLPRLVTIISLLPPIKFLDPFWRTDGYLDGRGDKYIDFSALNDQRIPAHRV